MSELTHEETKAQVQIAEKCDPYSMVEIPATTYLHLARMANRKVWPRKGPGLDGLWAVFVPKSLYTESDAPIVTVNYESAEEAMAAVDHNWPGKDDEPAGGEDETEDWATRYWRERCIAKECELESMRRALSRTSDAGTGSVVPEAIKRLPYELRREAENRCGCCDPDATMPGCDCMNLDDARGEGRDQEKLDIASRLDRAIAQQGK